MSLCLKYLILLRDARRPFWMGKHTPASLKEERERTVKDKLSTKAGNEPEDDISSFRVGWYCTRYCCKAI